MRLNIEIPMEQIGQVALVALSAIITAPRYLALKVLHRQVAISGLKIVRPRFQVVLLLCRIFQCDF